MSPALRSVLLASLVCGFTALLAPGCSQQGEGERCDKAKTQNSDCDSGLVCVARNQLVDRSTDRCCPATPGDESDARCRRGSVTGAGGSPDSGEPPAPDGEGGSSAGAAGATTTTPDAGGNGGAAQEPPTTGGAGAGGATAGAPATDGGAPSPAGGAAGAGGV